jgi:predicted alpha/beta-fold hydrolase
MMFSRDNYVTHFVDKAIKSDCKAIVMNYRGIECDLLTPRTYSATNLDDLHLVVERIKQRFPKDKLFVIGISLGGLKLGQYLAKQYDNSTISYAMIISAAFNTHKSANELEKSTNRFFNKFLAHNISRFLVK